MLPLVLELSEEELDELVEQATVEEACLAHTAVHYSLARRYGGFRGFGRHAMARAARDRLARTLRGDARTAFSVELTARTGDLSLEVEGFGSVKSPVTPRGPASCSVSVSRAGSAVVSRR